MKRCFALLALLGAAAAAFGEEVVIDFEQAEIGKPVPTWTEKGVVIKLAGPLTQSKAAGRVMFFPHLATNHKGILNAMATEQAVPVQATFPNSASAVTLHSCSKSASATANNFCGRRRTSRKRTSSASKCTGPESAD